MSALRENAIARVATVTGVDLNSASKQTLFTVPAGKSFFPVMVVLRNASAAATTSDADIGGNAAADDWLPDKAHFDNLSGVGSAVAVYPRGIASGSLVAPAVTEYAAGTEFGIKPGTLNSATVDVDVFGYLI